MRSYHIRHINLKLFFLFSILSLVCLFGLMAISFYLGMNWLLGIVMSTLIMFYVSDKLEIVASRTININFDDSRIEFNAINKNKKTFNANYKNIKYYKVKYRSLNFPSFSLTLEDGKKFKFYCKDRSDDNFIDFVNDFGELMDEKQIQGKVK